MKKSLSNRISRHAVFACLAVLFFSGRAFGDESPANQPLIEVRASVDRSVITIGDRITYSLRISHSDSLHIQQPGPGANLGGFEIKDYHIADPIHRNGRTIQKFDYTIAVFDTGHYQIPPFPVAYSTGDSTKNFKIIKSEPISITVKSVLTGDNDKLADVKPPLPIPMNYRFWIIVGAAAALLALGGFFGYRIYRKRQKGEPLFRKEMIRPAHEIAFEELDRLIKSDWLKQKKYKAFYSELTDILRRYLEHRFFISAMEATTAELMDALQELSLGEENLQLAKTVCDTSDLVKFAKYIPSADETDEMIRRVRQFIENTAMEFESVEHLEKIPEAEEESEPAPPSPPVSG